MSIWQWDVGVFPAQDEWPDLPLKKKVIYNIEI